MQKTPSKSADELADEAFDSIYPLCYRKISRFHFTPVHVARVAARFLAEKQGARVLDVGAGAGKFCMVGATCTQGHFTGVEQRESLCRLASGLLKQQGTVRVEFIHANILSIDFQAFDAIYYFNAFYENKVPGSAIDQSVPLDKDLYARYTRYMREQLDKMPTGTRLATYFSFMDEIPGSFKIQATDFDLKLKLWEKDV